MPTENYSKRELDSKFGNLLEHMKEFEADVKESLGSILTQTTRTNGRVTKLERWQSYVVGFCAAVTILMLPVVYLLVQRLI